MPVDGDSRAAWHSTSGSNAFASAFVCSFKSLTPLAYALLRIDSSVSTCASEVATMSLPHCRYGMPRLA
eukprot:5953462-Amphidinium_carterae.1